jgi:hypothetical protein
MHPYKYERFSSLSVKMNSNEPGRVRVINRVNLAGRVKVCPSEPRQSGQELLFISRVVAVKSLCPQITSPPRRPGRVRVNASEGGAAVRGADGARGHAWRHSRPRHGCGRRRRLGGRRPWPCAEAQRRSHRLPATQMVSKHSHECLCWIKKRPCRLH